MGETQRPRGDATLKQRQFRAQVLLLEAPKRFWTSHKVDFEGGFQRNFSRTPLRFWGPSHVFATRREFWGRAGSRNLELGLGPVAPRSP